jgi:hypothetical protein
VIKEKPGGPKMFGRGLRHKRTPPHARVGRARWRKFRNPAYGRKTGAGKEVANYS